MDLLTYEDARHRFESFWRVLGENPELHRKWVEQSEAKWKPIVDDVYGYGFDLHYSFFQGLLHLFPLRRILVVGVYHGRDICFLMKAAETTGRKELQILGVDKFSDDFCRDWPEEKRNLGWEAAGFGCPPSLQDARDNISRHQTCPVELAQSDDLQFLASCQEKFDFIYLDTAHDYETVRQQIELCQPLLAPGGLIGGDDLEDEAVEGWGVRAAVDEKFSHYIHLNDWIWLTHSSQYRSTTREQVA
jgi:hypothetical protein